MSLDRMLILAAVLCFAAAVGVYAFALGDAFPVMAATQNGPYPVPANHMRQCLHDRALSLFGDKVAQYYWNDCKAHFARYRAVAGQDGYRP